MTLESGPDGQPLTIQVAYDGRIVTARIWRVRVGRVNLFLLDTNVSANRPDDRDITDQLYGGDLEVRLKQEILLGIGGFRALKALGLAPTVYHMNEGHSSFLAVEWVRRLTEKHNLSFTIPLIRSESTSTPVKSFLLAQRRSSSKEKILNIRRLKGRWLLSRLAIPAVCS